MTYFELAYEVLSRAKIPLTENEIFQKAREYGLDKKLISIGKTPTATISAQLYVNMKRNGESSPIIKVGTNPRKFGLRGQTYSDEQNIYVEKIETTQFSEADLHPLLSTFVYSNEYFNCYTKTINHLSSKKGKSGEKSWLHPDIVGVHYPFNDFNNDETTEFSKILKDSRVVFYSFELKKDTINFSNIRECYFQAVSNSSWANEGYLVAPKFLDTDDFSMEMDRLNNAFGIGFIELDFENIAESEVLFQAKRKDFLDWSTIDKLAENSSFKSFMKTVKKDLSSNEVRNEADYDKTLTDENELAKYLKKIGASR